VAGPSLAFELAEETGAAPDEIVRAHLVAWQVFDQGTMWQATAALDHQVAAEVQVRMYLESHRLVERATRWFLRNRRRPLPIAATLEAMRPLVNRALTVLPTLLRGNEANWLEQCGNELVGAGVPAALAQRVALLDASFAALDIADVATAEQTDVERVAACYAVVGDRLRLDWLRDRVIDDLPRDDRWQALARSAMRDDAYSVHRAITAAVLRVGDQGAEATTAYDRWVTGHGGAVERATAVLDDVRSHGVFDLATLSVALRELRNLAG
jgi:glutamate dehydrogenase